jgi:uncharacterized protein (DUF2236 family)
MTDNESVAFEEITEDLVDGYTWVLDELPAKLGKDSVATFSVMGWSAGAHSTALAVSRVAVRKHPSSFSAVDSSP